MSQSYAATRPHTTLTPAEDGDSRDHRSFRSVGEGERSEFGPLSSRPLGAIRDGASNMQLTRTASFLIAPGKNLDQPPEVEGTFIAAKGRLHQMLKDVFDRSDQECHIPIRFVMSLEGRRENPARDLLVGFIKSPSMANGRALAERLRDTTTNRSGLGLLFILLGSDKKAHKILLSRFPADQGVVAEAKRGTLAVEFIERVFMKNAATYKAALYSGSSLDSHFWLGSVVDKQLNMSPHQAANYWIREFLHSDFETTSKQGTKRFAVALRDASHSIQDPAVKHELLATSMLVKGIAGQVLSINGIFDRFSLSESARQAVLSKLPYARLAEDSFLFDPEEFLAHAALASVELNSGALLLAPPDKFEQVFTKEAIDEAGQEYLFSTRGKIVDERVRGRR